MRANSNGKYIYGFISASSTIQSPVHLMSARSVLASQLAAASAEMSLRHADYIRCRNLVAMLARQMAAMVDSGDAAPGLHEGQSSQLGHRAVPESHVDERSLSHEGQPIASEDLVSPAIGSVRSSSECDNGIAFEALPTHALTAVDKSLVHQEESPTAVQGSPCAKRSVVAKFINPSKAMADLPKKNDCSQQFGGGHYVTAGTATAEDGRPTTRDSVADERGARVAASKFLASCRQDAFAQGKLLHAEEELREIAKATPPLGSTLGMMTEGHSVQAEIRAASSVPRQSSQPLRKRRAPADIADICPACERIQRGLRSNRAHWPGCSQFGRGTAKRAVVAKDADKPQLCTGSAGKC